MIEAINSIFLGLSFSPFQYILLFLQKNGIVRCHFFLSGLAAHWWIQLSKVGRFWSCNIWCKQIAEPASTWRARCTWYLALDFGDKWFSSYSSLSIVVFQIEAFLSKDVYVLGLMWIWVILENKLQYFLEDGRHSYVLSSSINTKNTFLIWISMLVTSIVSL